MNCFNSNQLDQSGLIPINEFNKIASNILQDRKQVNRIVDLVNLLSKIDTIPTNDVYFQSLVRCLTKIFTNYIDSREMVLFVCKSNETEEQIKKINTYKSWLIKLYESVTDLFVRILQSNDSKYSFNLKKVLLESLVKFIEEEGKFPFRHTNENETSFPVDLLEKIIEALVSEKDHNQELIKIYSNYYQYDDFIHHTMKILHKIIETHKGSDNINIIANLIDFIHPIRLIPPEDLLPKSLQIADVNIKRKKNKKSKGEHKTWMRLCELQKYNNEESGHQTISLPVKKFKFDYERDAAIYSLLWLKYLSFRMPPSTYKSVLVYLDKYAIQHFSNPLLLADFLINSFQTGGIISLLSLSPLYTLIHKCNLEYPNFFGQLYTLLEPAITYVKHRPRFLFWCDLFLTTTHIPATIVASFAKKFARLTLVSTPDTILILLPFIGNLFIRHPLIKKMLDYKQLEPEQDPFLNDETDPEKTNALKSYMWELSLLQSHYHPEIASLSKQICTELPRFEWNLEDILDISLNDVAEKAKISLQDDKKFTYDIDCGIYYEL